MITKKQDGFYEQKSTLDYNGIYKEKYIEFDAKELLAQVPGASLILG